VLLFSLCATLPVSAQAPETASDRTTREQAFSLFQQGKRLEALPLLEELVKAAPRDTSLLVTLAACLVEHAATLPDQQGGGKERLRARELVDRAREQGDQSVLALNLSQLLKQLPETGSIRFSSDPRVDQTMRAGEMAFSRRDFPEAIQHYSKALELEPGNYSAALFVANSYDRQDQFAPASQWYERAIQLDRNVETAYRYYADMLAKQSDWAKSRAMLIHAAVAEPYNRMVWRELKAWATLNSTQIVEVFVGVPPEPGGGKNAPPASSASIWQPYWEVRQHWQKGDEFRNRFPVEAKYRHSLLEEAQALTSVAENLMKLERGGELPESVHRDESADLLLKLHKARLIEPYVLFSLGDSGIARDYDGYRARNRDKLEEYLDRFVVPPPNLREAHQ
jgi:tetratricopeptide (TPR) repeat protein